MKMDKIFIILFIGFLIGGFFLIQSGSKKDKKKRERLALTGGFAIGNYEGRSMSNNRTYSIAYTYLVDSNELRGGDGHCYDDSSKAAEVFTDPQKTKTGDKFLVLYNKDKPKESIIRLDYPIKDSTDFKRYVKEFEQMRKQVNE